MHLLPSIFNTSAVIAAQSTRDGGVSPAPFNSLNLGLSVNDLPENVMKNRALFFNSLGIELNQLSISKQVHGAAILHAGKPQITEGYDAQISNTKGLFLVVSVADCTPILIHDEKENAVAAIHAGWRGTVSNIVGNTLAKMKATFGTEGKNCKAFIGACIDYEQFEVGEEVAAHFDSAFKRFDAGKQKYFVNLKAANREQLLRFGVPPENIEISNYCTAANNDLFFSHRKEKGNTGRMMAVIGLK
ncbi:MAG: peptidoglycan editing factor PgeF [Bacteroidia bacterium]|nr:peptidoglycan editing factor PgeF [Bacteroidia bacterium]